MKTVFAHIAFLTIAIISFSFNNSEPDCREVFEAVKENNIDKVKSLLAANGNCVNATNLDGETPLYMAVSENHTEMVKALLNFKPLTEKSENRGLTPLHKACINGNYDIALMLINAGANVNAESSIGYTCLMYAADENLKFVSLLVDKGAKLNATGPMGETALMEAARHGSLENVKYLISKGADHKLQDSEGKTAADIAADNNHPEIAEFLRGLE